MRVGPTSVTKRMPTAPCCAVTFTTAHQLSVCTTRVKQGSSSTMNWRNVPRVLGKARNAKPDLLRAQGFLGPSAPCIKNDFAVILHGVAAIAGIAVDDTELDAELACEEVLPVRFVLRQQTARRRVRMTPREHKRVCGVAAAILLPHAQIICTPS